MSLSPAFPIAPGSPPRMRGKLVGGRNRAVSDGITPAHAGKTHKGLPAGARAGDHPRACGENLPESHHPSSQPGSPPRMRGKRCHKAGVYLCAGITPAHAGKTRFALAAPDSCRDHPRACGENRASLETRVLTMGSPPRMRGKLLDAFNVGTHFGITPAHAGKTR